jgi:2-oxoglutarate dehydrogenase E2 component (dihydrolipoamide succinyltransferase)
MAIIEMVMPKMGESIMEGTILTWLKKEGDKIEQDESVLEVATDKVDTEVPATHSGILKKIIAPAGAVIEVGKPIALIATGADAQHDAPQPVVEPTLQAVEPAIESHVNELETQIASVTQNHSFTRLAQPAVGRFYSPLVLTIAREEGVSMHDLEYIPGTGSENRVTKKDILNYVASLKQPQTATTTVSVEQPVFQPAESNYNTAPTEVTSPVWEEKPESITAKATEPTPQTTPTRPVQSETKVTQEPVVQKQPESQTQQPAYVPSQPVEPVSKPAVSTNGRYEIVEMDRMRKMIAQRMVDSKRIAPHVTSFVEVDVTNIVYWRNRIKQDFKAREGDTITYTPIFIEAIAKAIKDYPMINSSVDGDKILVKRDINIGMAVALPTGNLIVPVIKNADQLNMVGLTKKVNDLARRARDGKLTADDLSEGTFTMSNVGSFGNVMGTPIILQPQVAIMAFGAIQKKPAVIETAFGDTLGIRHMMFLSHSYDHRIIDGSLGGMFVRRVADYLEAFDVNRKVF